MSLVKCLNFNLVVKRGGGYRIKMLNMTDEVITIPIEVGGEQVIYRLKPNSESRYESMSADVKILGKQLLLFQNLVIKASEVKIQSEASPEMEKVEPKLNSMAMNRALNDLIEQCEMCHKSFNYVIKTSNGKIISSRVE